MTALDLTDESSFTYWCEDKIRFADLDTYGHLNNVAYATSRAAGWTFYPRSSKVLWTAKERAG